MLRALRKGAVAVTTEMLPQDVGARCLRHLDLLLGSGNGEGGASTGALFHSGSSLPAAPAAALESGPPPPGRVPSALVAPAWHWTKGPPRPSTLAPSPAVRAGTLSELPQGQAPGQAQDLLRALRALADVPAAVWFWTAWLLVPGVQVCGPVTRPQQRRPRAPAAAVHGCRRCRGAAAWVLWGGRFFWGGGGGGGVL